MKYVGNHFYSRQHLNFSKIVGTSKLVSGATPAFVGIRIPENASEFWICFLAPGLHITKMYSSC